LGETSINIFNQSSNQRIQINNTTLLLQVFVRELRKVKDKIPNRYPQNRKPKSKCAATRTAPHEPPAPAEVNAAADNANHVDSAQHLPE
jgi:hypothetical protein